MSPTARAPKPKTLLTAAIVLAAAIFVALGIADAIRTNTLHGDEIRWYEVEKACAIKYRFKGHARIGQCKSEAHARGLPANPDNDADIVR